MFGLLKKFLAILFSCSLMFSSVTVANEKNQQSFVERHKATLEDFVKDHPLQVVGGSVVAMVVAIIVHILVIKSKNKTIVSKNTGINHQVETIQDKDLELKELFESLTSKRLDDCSDEKGVNVDTALAFMKSNINSLKGPFQFLNINRAFIANFEKIFEAVENEYIKLTSRSETLEAVLKKTKEKFEKLEVQNIELKHNTYGQKCRIIDLQNSQNAFVDFIKDNEEVRILFQNVVTGSPYTPDIYYLHCSDTLEKNKIQQADDCCNIDRKWNSPLLLTYPNHT